MPAYSQGNAVPLYPGAQPLYLFNNEAVAAGSKSMAFERAVSNYAPPGSDQGSTVQLLFAANATAVIALQGSNVDIDADYITLESATFSGSGSQGSITDTQRFLYYRLLVVSYSAGGNLTALATR